MEFVEYTYVYAIMLFVRNHRNALIGTLVLKKLWLCKKPHNTQESNN